MKHIGPAGLYAIILVLVAEHTVAERTVDVSRWAIGKEFSLDLDPFLILILTLSVIHAHFVSSGKFAHHCHRGAVLYVSYAAFMHILCCLSPSSFLRSILALTNTFAACDYLTVCFQPQLCAQSFMCWTTGRGEIPVL